MRVRIEWRICGRRTIGVHVTYAISMPTPTLAWLMPESLPSPSVFGSQSSRRWIVATSASFDHVTWLPYSSYRRQPRAEQVRVETSPRASRATRDFLTRMESCIWLAAAASPERGGCSLGDVGHFPVGPGPHERGLQRFAH